jgi:hypothetical protein
MPSAPLLAGCASSASHQRCSFVSPRLASSWFRHVHPAPELILYSRPALSTAVGNCNKGNIFLSLSCNFFDNTSCSVVVNGYNQMPVDAQLF